jgi:outer membrane receptor protein involved in Fe transport
MKPLMLFLLLLFNLKSVPAVSSQLKIRVVDSQEAVIVGAAVEVRGKDNSFSGQTDEKGEVATMVDLPATIRVSAIGFSDFDRRLEVLPSDWLVIRLRPAVVHTTIEVVVRDEDELTQTHERTALEIEREGARTVYDAVDKLVPGAYVTRRGFMGYGLNSPSGAISIRGIGSIPNTQVLMVIDGRPDFMGLMGHPIPDFYTLSDVGSLSVTEGPASVRYGSGAMGGAIEVRSAPISEGFHTEFTTSFGSFDSGQHRLSHEARIGQSYYRLTAGIAHTSGDRPNSAFHGQDGTLTLGYSLSSIWNVSLEGRYGHFNVEDPGTITAPVAAHYADVGRGGFNISLKNSSARNWGSTSYFSSYGHHMLWDGFRSTDDTKGVRHDQSFLITPQFTLETGASIIRYGGRARNIQSSLEYGNHHASEEGIFSQARYVLSGELVLNAGLRYAHNSLYGGIAVPEFGASYQLSSRYSISAAISEGFRNPTIRELYLFPAPNPSLEPERLWNYQTTVQMHPVQSLLFWTTFFYSDINDLIVAIGVWPNLQLENAGQALNKGFEINGRWQPARRINLNAGYAYLHSTNLAPYVPNHKINYSLDFSKGRIFLSLSGTFIGRTWADTGKSQQLDPYSTLTVNCIASIRKHVSMFATLDNILNSHYQVVAGYPMPGINVIGGLKFRF